MSSDFNEYELVWSLRRMVFSPDIALWDTLVRELGAAGAGSFQLHGPNFFPVYRRRIHRPLLLFRPPDEIRAARQLVPVSDGNCRSVYCNHSRVLLVISKFETLQITRCNSFRLLLLLTGTCNGEFWSGSLDILLRNYRNHRPSASIAIGDKLTFFSGSNRSSSTLPSRGQGTARVYI